MHASRAKRFGLRRSSAAFVEGGGEREAGRSYRWDHIRPRAHRELPRTRRKTAAVQSALRASVLKLSFVPRNAFRQSFRAHIRRHDPGLTEMCHHELLPDLS